MSKSLKKLIDINRLREFKNKLVGTDSAYVQTGAVDQTVGGTKTFSKPIAGSVTGSSGSCTGNAATATQFSANATVALTGDATGTSAGSKKGWSVPVTLANSGVTAGTYGPSADVTGNNNATISVPEITVDAKGRVTSVTNRTLTCKNNTYSVYNKTLTIQKNGTKVATFTSNSNTDVAANITVPTKVSELTNDSGFLTSHQSLSNYSTLANTIKSLSISGKTITYTKGDNTTGTLTTQDTNTDTLMTQNVSTTNSTYPILLCPTANATSNQGAKTGIFAKSVKVNPSTNVISASGFSGPLTGNVTGNCSGSSGSCTGNAATATKLAAKRTIALSGAATGTATGFDGSGNITIPVTALDASKLTGTASVSTTGNAATATKATKAEQDGNGNNIVASYVAAGSEGSTTDIGAFMAARPSFIKSFTYNNVWTDAISMRHRNGSGDGPNYGTYIRSSNMTGTSNLLWNHQSAGEWQGERTLIDSANLADFIPVTVPAGVIIPFAGTSVPTGYLLCNGAAVSRTDYANLFAAIGTLYGAGDGSTTFNLPDARDRVLQGASGTHSAGSYIAAGLPNITGTLYQGAACAAIQTEAGAFSGDGSTNHASQNFDGNMFSNTVLFDASRSNAQYGANLTVQPPAIATNFIIKY